MTIDIAIIGAGMTGLTCAQILQQAGYQVVILEKSRGVGGRMATKRLPDVRADHGTCYVSPKGEVFEQFIQDLTDRGVVRVWTDAVYELLPDRTLQAPTERIPRYVATTGMSAIAKVLTPNLDIRFNQRVIKLELIENQWQLTLETTAPATNFPTLLAKAVILTPPAPQAADLLLPLKNSVLSADFIDAVQGVEFLPCIAVMAGYKAERLQDWQVQFPAVQAIAVQNDAIAWVGLDSSKRAIASQPVFVVQSQAGFAQRHLETPDLMPVGQSLLQTAADLLAPWLAQPDWIQVHRWRYAFASSPRSEPYLSADAIAPLFCAGDWCGGMRVETAVLSGIAVAQALNDQWQQRPLPDQPFWQRSR